LLKKLANARMSAVMVEGGAEVSTSFLKAKMVDRIIVAIAPMIIGNGIEAIGDLGIKMVDESIKLVNVTTRKRGPDLLISGDVHYND